MGAGMTTHYYEAAAFARDAHAGQVDKGNCDYFTAHVEEVVRIVREELGGSISDAVVAYLHDVVEDTNIEVSDIADLFGDDIAGHIDAVTRRYGETYVDYIARVKAHGGSAVIVKTADMIEHLNRAGNISESLIRRYANALAVLTS